MQINYKSASIPFIISLIIVQLNQLFFSDKVISQTNERFELREINMKKVVIDHKMGLMWQKAGAPRRLQYEDRLSETVHDYINDINEERFAGFSDWRLPTLKEAKSLMTEEKQTNSLYIDPIFDSRQHDMWTSDTERLTGFHRACDIVVWKVYFEKGMCAKTCNSSYGSVRAVRYFR